MDNNTQRHDYMLMEILQEKKTVLGFLQSVFGFLSRCTDFYHVMKSNDENVGFPQGFKEHLVLQVMKQFEISIDKEQTMHLIPPVNNEIEIESEDVKEVLIESEDNEQMEENKNQIEKDKLKINLESQINSAFQPNEFYNGAKFKNYCWSQNLNDIEIHILLPNDCLSVKNLKVDIGPDSIKILDNKSNLIILEGQFYSKCKNNDAVWSISEKKLQINLDKIKPIWWHKLLLYEEPIDLSKMDCSRPLYELPQEEQAVIEKLQWDHHQKMLGLPTSDEKKNYDILKIAWNAEGSPFRGKPFDPASVNFE